MAFCITFGTHEFTNQLEGYENITAQCHNCGNWSAHCITRWPFFTVCWIPLIPLSTHKYKEVACPICNFRQDLSMRADIQSQHSGQPQPQIQGQPQHYPPKGAINAPGYGGPPPPGGPPGGGLPQYK